MLTIRDSCNKAYSTRLNHVQADLIWCESTFNSLIKVRPSQEKMLEVFWFAAILASILKRHSLTYHDHTSTRWLISAL